MCMCVCVCERERDVIVKLSDRHQFQGNEDYNHESFNA